MKNNQYLSFFETDEKLNILNDFKDFLIEKNNQFNLTSIVKEDEIFIKHFFDSLFGKDYISKNSNVVEIGSGGGFPSVPLKIYRDDLNFTLIESVRKKCVFLNEVKSKFNFKNFEIINARSEDIAKNLNFRESFDFAVARAVASLNTLLEYTLPLVKKGGFFIAYKGDAEEEIKNAQNALKVLGGKIVKKVEYSLPLDMGKRTLIIIEKINDTPTKYPRGQGRERSKPL